VPAESAATILRGERVGVLCRFDPTAGVPETDPNARTIMVGPDTPAPPVAAAPIPAPKSIITEAPVTPTKRHVGTIEPATIPASPLAMLAVYGPEGEAQEVFPLTTRGAQIGRGLQAGNDIVLDDGMVSKKHARILYENGQFFLHDENSTNGTYIGEAQLASGATVPVRSGDMLRIGMTYIRFALTPQNTPPPPDPTMPAPPRHTPPPPPGWKEGETRFDWEGREEFRSSVGANAFRLVAQNGEIHPLASEMTVGRALTGDITLIGNGVATQHARLTIQGGNLYVEDLNTQGGTTVNGERIPAHFKVALYDGDTIAFGDVELHVQRFTVGKGG
jgi:pSer/pThr/pTyr-binding forkhead associated (FHA) protein